MYITMTIFNTYPAFNSSAFYTGGMLDTTITYIFNSAVVSNVVYTVYDGTVGLATDIHISCTRDCYWNYFIM